MKIILVATNAYIEEQFQLYFDEYDDTHVHLGRFEELRAEGLASPANSFGLMDGGMDAAITAYFGDQLQQRVQARIIEKYCGEQPVGTSFIIETGSEKIPYLAHTPTMRVPTDIRGTDNVYRATKATLIAARRAGIHSIVLPAFGAGVGRMHPQEVARQMYLAYKHVNNPPESIDWNYARFRDYEIWGR